MSRLLAVLLLGLLVLVPGAATAAQPNDSVTGGGWHVGTQFTVSAHSGPNGEDAQGHISFKPEDGPRTRAEVTCLVVLGNGLVATAFHASRCVLPQLERSSS